MKFRWLRLTTALVAAGSAVVVWQIAELMIATAHASALMIGVLLGAGVAGIAAGALVLAPGWFLQRLCDTAASLLCAVRAVEMCDHRRTGLIMIALGVLTYVTVLGRLLSSPGDLGTSDEAAFLESAAAVRDSGGPLRLIADLYGGRFAEANRHPLYIALLSLRPTEQFGRGLSASLGLLTLLSLTLLTARSRGMLVAGLFCILLATNMAFCRFSLRVVCDVLMVLWGGLAFLLLTRGGNSTAVQVKGARVRSEADGPAHVGPGLSVGQTRPPSLFFIRFRDALLVGALLGMAYFTKGTGLLLLFGTLGAMVLIWGLGLTHPRTEKSLVDDETARPEGASAIPPRRPSWRRTVLTLALVILGWMVVASPLLVRNVRMYGTPLYNLNTWLLFVDTFESPEALSQRQTVAEAARTYWESHTVLDVVRREISGLAWETFILLRMLGPFPLDDSRVLFGLPIVLLAVLSLLARPSGEGVLLASWTALFVVVFAWYVPIAAGERFLLPLLAPLLLSAAHGVCRLAGLGATVDHGRQRRQITVTAILWCGVSIVLSYTTRWPIAVP